MKLNVEKGKQGFQEVERTEVNGLVLGPDPEHLAYTDRLHEVADEFVLGLTPEQGAEFIDRNWDRVDKNPETTFEDAVYDTAHSVAAEAVREGEDEAGVMHLLQGKQTVQA